MDANIITKKQFQENVSSLTTITTVFPLTAVLETVDVGLCYLDNLFADKDVTDMCFEFVSDKHNADDIVSREYIDKYLYTCDYIIENMTFGKLSNLHIGERSHYPFGTAGKYTNPSMTLTFPDIKAVRLVKKMVSIVVTTTVATYNDHFTQTLLSQPFVIVGHDGGHHSFADGMMCYWTPEHPRTIGRPDRGNIEQFGGSPFEFGKYRGFFISKPLVKDGLAFTLNQTTFAVLAEGYDIASYYSQTPLNTNSFVKDDNHVKFYHRIPRHSDALANLAIEFPEGVNGEILSSVRLSIREGYGGMLYPLDYVKLGRTFQIEKYTKSNPLIPGMGSPEFLYLCIEMKETSFMNKILSGITVMMTCSVIKNDIRKLIEPDKPYFTYQFQV